METIKCKTKLELQEEFYSKLDGKHSKLEDDLHQNSANMWTYGMMYEYDNELYDLFTEGYYDGLVTE